MKIAQVAPLFESVPPKGYGGTERIVSYLTEELVRQGHEVVLFASGDSVTRARLEAVVDQGLRLHPRCMDPYAHHILMLERLRKFAGDFDVVHFHIDYLHFPLVRHLGVPSVTTLHGRLDLPDLAPLYQEFNDLPLISISRSQRRPLPFAHWVGTIHHGLPPELYEFHPEPGGYLAFLGRISPEKRPDRAIEIAIRTGLPLRLAAKVDRADQVYFDTRIRPLLDHPLVEFLGEIGEGEKSDFLGGALALLFPIDWPEPFGLVMIESLACGTPVIAYRAGSVEEVIDHGDTGFIVDNLAEAVAAVARVQELSRWRCREVFEERFTVSRMTREYVAAYQQVILGAWAWPQVAQKTGGVYGEKPRYVS